MIIFPDVNAGILRSILIHICLQVSGPGAWINGTQYLIPKT